MKYQIFHPYCYWWKLPKLGWLLIITILVPRITFKKVQTPVGPSASVNIHQKDYNLILLIMSLNNMFTSNSAIKATLHILLLFTTKHGNLTDPISRLAPFSIAIMPAKAQKSALEMPCSSSPSFRYLSSRGSRASARPAFADWFRLMQPLQPPTQLWNAERKTYFFFFFRIEM